MTNTGLRVWRAGIRSMEPGRNKDEKELGRFDGSRGVLPRVKATGCVCMYSR